MTDLFNTKQISPMLIADEVEAFDDPDFLYELKFDGIRCIVFLDPKAKTTRFYNKRHMLLNPHFPELLQIHKNVKQKCILDGEVFVMNNGRPTFSDVQKRALTNDKFKIELQSKKLPASFVAYDILYLRDKEITDLPLLKRKEKLESVIKSENELFSYSRYNVGQGIKLYELTESQNLEGIVAKRIDSKYYQGKRSKDWLKIKMMLDDDFVICGYEVKEHIRTIVLGQYDELGELVYRGRVAGISKDAFNEILNVKRVKPHFSKLGEYDIEWIQPELVCKIKFMEYSAKGGLRQPVFVSLRNDKLPKECKLRLK